MQVFDSNGPDVRIRGTAYQICEKYAALAKDAASSGDRILAESYLQHAEHYQRIISSWGAETPVRDDRFGQGQQPAEHAAPASQPADDLGLPASIIGARAEVASPEMENA
jgi:hypothetical protein